MSSQPGPDETPVQVEFIDSRVGWGLLEGGITMVFELSQLPDPVSRLGQRIALVRVSKFEVQFPGELQAKPPVWILLTARLKGQDIIRDLPKLGSGEIAAVVDAYDAQLEPPSRLSLEAMHGLGLATVKRLQHP